MIVNIKVSNFLSFNEETELSLSAGKIRRNADRIYTNRNVRILKCLSIFGPNASGKSNLMRVIFFIKKSLIENKIPREYTNKYYKLDKKNIDKPSKFEISILINKRIYVYGFTVILSKGQFVDEWLYEKNNNKLLFKLNSYESIFEVGTYFKNKKTIRRLEIYGNDCMGTNSLFLRNINDKKDKMYEDFGELDILRDIFNWFVFSLKIHFPSNRLDIYPDFIESNIEQISKILNALDTGVTKLSYIQETVNQIKNKIPNELISDIYDDLMLQEDDKHTKSILVRSDKQFYTFELNKDNEMVVTSLQFTHNIKDIYFDMDEESDGTTHLLDLVEILLDTKRERTFVFDEIERCLHPAITVKFLELFLELAKERNNQLIITTHESRILAEDILRNDEIIFIKKDKMGASNIITLDSKKLRSDKKVYQAFFDLKNGLDVLPEIDNKVLYNITR